MPDSTQQTSGNLRQVAAAPANILADATLGQQAQFSGRLSLERYRELAQCRHPLAPEVFELDRWIGPGCKLTAEQEVPEMEKFLVRMMNRRPFHRVATASYNYNYAEFGKFNRTTPRLMAALSMELDPNRTYWDPEKNDPDRIPRDQLLRGARIFRSAGNKCSDLRVAIEDVRKQARPFLDRRDIDITSMIVLVDQIRNARAPSDEVNGFWRVQVVCCYEKRTSLLPVSVQRDINLMIYPPWGERGSGRAHPRSDMTEVEKMFAEWKRGRPYTTVQQFGVRMRSGIRPGDPHDRAKNHFILSTLTEEDLTQTTRAPLQELKMDVDYGPGGMISDDWQWMAGGQETKGPRGYLQEQKERGFGLQGYIISMEWGQWPENYSRRGNRYSYSMLFTQGKLPPKGVKQDFEAVCIVGGRMGNWGAAGEDDAIIGAAEGQRLEGQQKRGHTVRFRRGKFQYDWGPMLANLHIGGRWLALILKEEAEEE